MLVDSSAPKIATYTNPQGKKPFKMPISNKFNVEDFFISFESLPFTLETNKYANLNFGIVMGSLKKTDTNINIPTTNDNPC